MPPLATSREGRADERADEPDAIAKKYRVISMPQSCCRKCCIDNEEEGGVCMHEQEIAIDVAVAVVVDVDVDVDHAMNDPPLPR